MVRWYIECSGNLKAVKDRGKNCIPAFAEMIKVMFFFFVVQVLCGRFALSCIFVFTSTKKYLKARNNLR